MLKNLLKQLRKQLLKSKRIKQAVTDSLNRKELAGALLSGGCIHMPEKSEDVLTVEYEDGLLVSYQDGRMVGQRGVVPFVMRPMGLWRWKL